MEGPQQGIHFQTRRAYRHRRRSSAKRLKNIIDLKP